MGQAGAAVFLILRVQKAEEEEEEEEEAPESFLGAGDLGIMFRQVAGETQDVATIEYVQRADVFSDLFHIHTVVISTQQAVPVQSDHCTKATGYGKTLLITWQR